MNKDNKIFHFIQNNGAQIAKYLTIGNSVLLGVALFALSTKEYRNLKIAKIAAF